jgi:hypothetical protein
MVQQIICEANYLLTSKNFEWPKTAFWAKKGLPSDGFCGKKAFFISIRAETFGFGL